MMHLCPLEEDGKEERGKENKEAPETETLSSFQQRSRKKASKNLHLQSSLCEKTRPKEKLSMTPINI